jgi:NAD(P)-dependent dehydrogenase (short-subunit alcohol dehydrogenase family)
MSPPRFSTPPPRPPPRSNNAGIQFVSPVESFPEDKWDDVMAVCLHATFHATKAAVPHMLQHGWGRIINTGSMHALVVRRRVAESFAGRDAHAASSGWQDLKQPA